MKPTMMKREKFFPPGQIQTPSTAGFTLIELLVVVGIMSIFMAAVFSLYQTHQRSAYTQEETVEVQQNLRVGMDQIMDDVRMGGFLVTSGTNPINAVNDNTGIMGTDTDNLGNPIGTDTLTLNTATASAVVTRNISLAQTVTLSPGPPVSLSVNSIETFLVGDIVVVVGAQSDNLVIADTFTLTEVNDVANGPCGGGAAAAPCLTLLAAVGGTATINPGDMIVRVGAGGYPNTVQYRVVNNVLNGACLAGQTCLERNANDGTGPQIIANNITGLQFRYVLQNGIEVDNPVALNQVRGVRVTLTGQRVNTTAYTGGAAQPKTLVSVVSIRNLNE